MSGPIIFVEDDEDDLFIFEEICGRLNLPNKLLFFQRGEAMLNYLRHTTEQPFIIFCDINMPEMDGLQLRERLNDEEQLRRKSIPFVFFSTAATRQQVKRAYELTVQGFFIKETNFTEAQANFKMILDYWAKCKHPNTMK
ncbi:MAG: response regulator [Chryseosolibacter sp.]